MNRRNFVAGLGALTAGGGAALGTGAFSSVEAERSVSVEVADDANAYLALEATSEYATENGDGVLELDFGTDLGTTNSGDDLGEHVGNDSSYVFGSGAQDRNVFTVRNQGTNKVKISPQYQVLRFDKDGNPVEEGGELVIALALGTGNVPEQAELNSGDTAGYYVQIVTGDNPPESLSASFEINANKIESE